MRRKLIYLVALLVGAVTSANAQSVQTLVLSNGSELDGYISAQRPGVDFTFSSNRALMYLNPAEVKSIVDHEVGIADLSDEWKTWAEAEDAYIGIGDNRVFVMSDITMNDGRVISGVRVLERGGRVKYLEYASNKHLLKWDQISLIKSVKRTRSQLTGIDRVYKLADGSEFAGQYAEEVPGKTVCLYNNNGFVEVIPMDKVVKDMRVKVNPHQSLFEQSEYLDIVEMQDGSIYRGIVIERNFTEDAVSSYLLIQTHNDSIISLKLNQVAEYRKEQNMEFKPLFDVLLREGEFMVNRTEVKAQTATIDDDMVFVDETQCGVDVAYMAPFVEISVESCFAKEEDYHNIKLIKMRKYRGEKQSILHGFAKSNLEKYSLHPLSVITSCNNTTKMTYNVYEPGLYIIYNVATNETYLFNVK